LVVEDTTEREPVQGGGIIEKEVVRELIVTAEWTENTDPLGKGRLTHPRYGRKPLHIDQSSKGRNKGIYSSDSRRLLSVKAGQKATHLPIMPCQKKADQRTIFMYQENTERERTEATWSGGCRSTGALSLNKKSSACREQEVQPVARLPGRQEWLSGRSSKKEGGSQASLSQRKTKKHNQP